MSIEQTLASMAHRQLTQNMPSIASNLLGFEIITNSDDNTFALGVNVAVIGDTYVFIPTILKNGRIAPVDLMYIPELDQFLPCKDAWITYIQSKKTDLLATLNKKKHNSGNAGNVSLDMPFNNITKVANSPTELKELLKYASSCMVDALCNAPNSTGIPCVEELVDIAGGNGLKKLASYLASTDGHDNLVEFYSDADLKRISDKLNTKLMEQPSIDIGSEGNVKLLTSASVEARSLSQDDKVKILRDGAIIVDNRGLTPSRIYKTKTNSDWCIPEQNGVYELLKIDGSTLTAYVFNKEKITNQTDNNPHTGRYRKSFYVVPLDDGQERIAYRVEDRDIIGQPYENINDFHLSGKNISAINSSGYSDFILLDGNNVAMKLSIYGSDRPAPIRKDDELIIPCAVSLDSARYTGGVIGTSNRDLHAGLGGIIVGRKKAKTRISGSYLRTGEDTVYIPITWDHSKAIQSLATSADIINVLSRRAGNIAVNIFKADNGVYIESDMVKTAGATDIEAEMALVERLALTPDAAHSIIKEANANFNHHNNYIVKLAADTHVALSANEQPVDDFESSSLTLGPMSNMSAEDRRILDNAVQSGTKEVFDVSVLRILAEEDSPTQIINEWMPTLFTALDKVGRILYLCRAGESMQDAYGADRVDDVERKLRKQFNELGDIILTMLKGKVKDFDDLLNGEL